MNISTGVLLTATALLAAILLVWAQLWVNTFKIYKEKQKKSRTTVDENINIATNLALTWTYGALAFTIIAFACIALGIWGGETWIKLGISALGISFSMLIIEVLISLLSAGFKFWNNKKYDEPVYLVINKDLTRLLLIGLPVCFTIFSLCAVFSRMYWLMFGNLAIIVVAGFVIWIDFYKKNDQSNGAE